MSSPLPKRKLDDYADDAVFPINPTRMRKDQTALPSSSSSPPSTSPPSRRSFPSGPTRPLNCLQFFVRMLSDQTLVFQADPTDTIKSIHHRIHSGTGIPVIEQRLIYRGKQLQWEQTLSDCGVQDDACLHLVGRMRSTGHPQAWQLINDLVSLVFYLYKNNPHPLLRLCRP